MLVAQAILRLLYEYVIINYSHHYELEPPRSRLYIRNSKLKLKKFILTQKPNTKY